MNQIWNIYLYDTTAKVMKPEISSKKSNKFQVPQHVTMKKSVLNITLLIFRMFFKIYVPLIEIKKGKEYSNYMFNTKHVYLSNA